MNNQIPAILQSKKKQKVHKQKEELTQADLQRLKVILSKSILDHQNFIFDHRCEISRAWPFCHKEDSRSTNWFNYLNSQKNYLRKLQNNLRNLEQTQKRIKSLLSN